MEAHIVVGTRCSVCGSTYEVTVANSSPTCSNCGGALATDPDSEGALTNFSCGKCGIFVAFMVGRHEC